MAKAKVDSGGFEYSATPGKEYRQVSAPRDGGSPNRSDAGEAVEAQDKSVAPREFSKGNGGGADAVVAGDKGVYPREFSKGGWYKPESPCENQLDKEAKQIGYPK